MEEGKITLQKVCFVTKKLGYDPPLRLDAELKPPIHSCNSLIRRMLVIPMFTYLNPVRPFGLILGNMDRQSSDFYFPQ